MPQRLAMKTLSRRSLVKDKAREIEPHFILLDAAKHSAISISPLKLEKRMEPRRIGPARFLQRRTAERMMFQGAC